jgi:hypothetical protein
MATINTIAAPMTAGALRWNFIKSLTMLIKEDYSPK